MTHFDFFGDLFRHPRARRDPLTSLEHLYAPTVSTRLSASRMDPRVRGDDDLPLLRPYLTAPLTGEEFASHFLT